MYEVRLQPDAENAINWLQKRDRGRLREVDKVIRKLMKDPYSNSIPLIDPFFNGFRRARAGMDRIIFQLCEECRADPTVFNDRGCHDCNEMSDNVLKIWNVVHRDEDTYKTS